jgi:hypothetical protein
MIIRNSIKTPDGTVLESLLVYDYVSHTDSITGATYAVDGGTIKPRIHAPDDYDDLTLVLDESLEPFDEIRSTFKWGTYGKKAYQPLTHVVLKNMTTGHIEAILATQFHIPLLVRNMFEKELEYRNEKRMNLLS